MQRRFLADRRRRAGGRAERRCSADLPDPTQPRAARAPLVLRGDARRCAGASGRADHAEGGGICRGPVRRHALLSWLAGVPRDARGPLARLMRRALWWLLVLILFVAAYLFGREYVRRHPQDVPWTKPDLRHPMGLFTLRKLASLVDRPAQCRALLAQ